MDWQEVGECAGRCVLQAEWEKNQPHCCQHKVEKRAAVIFWGSVTAHGLDDFTCVKGPLMLKSTYRSWSNICCHPDISQGGHCLFQEDNTIHICGEKNFLSSHSVFCHCRIWAWMRSNSCWKPKYVSSRMQLLLSYTGKVAQNCSKMAPSCFLCTFPQQPHKPEEINFLCSASLLCGLSLPGEIIIVFHTLPPAVGTHLDNYMQYSGEESILHNSANWARSREWLTAIFTSQSDRDEEQNLNVTFKNLHLSETVKEWKQHACIFKFICFSPQIKNIWISYSWYVAGLFLKPRWYSVVQETLGSSRMSRAVS